MCPTRSSQCCTSFWRRVSLLRTWQQPFCTRSFAPAHLTSSEEPERRKRGKKCEDRRSAGHAHAPPKKLEGLTRPRCRGFLCVFGFFFSRARRLPSPIVILQDLEREEVLVSSASMQGGGGGRGHCLALIVLPLCNQENPICGRGTLPHPLINNRAHVDDQLYLGWGG